MQMTSTENAIIEKTRELCQTILDQPDYQTLRRQVDAFLADDTAKAQYQTVIEKSEMLNHKQHQGTPLTPEEIADFEQQRETLLNNSVARDFLDAQQSMHKLQESVNEYLSKTFELGRVPAADDFDSGSCGHGCGCHH
jgi:cell fate (sporulation/competence/biofilm development) regulator YlbF (YheA/YmcA/DUF963 family)